MNDMSAMPWVDTGADTAPKVPAPPLLSLADEAALWAVVAQHTAERKRLQAEIVAIEARMDAHQQEVLHVMKRRDAALPTLDALAAISAVTGITCPLDAETALPAVIETLAVASDTIALASEAINDARQYVEAVAQYRKATDQEWTAAVRAGSACQASRALLATSTDAPAV